MLLFCLLQDAKKCHRNQRRETFMTGGGMANPVLTNIPELMLKVLDLIQPALEPVQCSFDSNATNADQTQLNPLPITAEDRKSKRRPHEENLLIAADIGQLEAQARLLEAVYKRSKQEYREEKRFMKAEIKALKQTLSTTVARSQIREWLEEETNS